MWRFGGGEGKGGKRYKRLVASGFKRAIDGGVSRGKNREKE